MRSCSDQDGGMDEYYPYQVLDDSGIAHCGRAYLPPALWWRLGKQLVNNRSIIELVTNDKIILNSTVDRLDLLGRLVWDGCQLSEALRVECDSEEPRAIDAATCIEIQIKEEGESLNVSDNGAYSMLREMLVAVLKGVWNIPRGVLMSGPPGVGKTHLDSIGCKRDSGSDQSQVRLLAQLLTLMDGAEGRRGNLLIIGATNRPNVLDPALRRPGRFDREIVIHPPDTEMRQTMLLNMLPEVDIALVEELAKRTIGYVAADLAALTRAIVLECVKRKGGGIGSQDESTRTVRITGDDANKALAGMTPSLIREYRVPVEGGLDWDDLGGMATIKMELQRAIEWPLQHKEAFSRLGLQQPRGVLLYGPPGCSKTTIAKILASRGSFSFYSLSGAAVFSAYVGEAERLVRQVFLSARQTAPSLIFIDEVDALVGKRGHGDMVQERVLSTLLNEMDGIETMRGVVVLGATNRLNAIDAALLRPGRFDRLVHIPLPERNDRLDILQKILQHTPIDKSIDLGAIADNTVGSSGADLKQLIQEAALCAIGRGHDRIEPSDLCY
ncbi:hypothetical protein PSACC_03712 [Paramicrosporidium saccamoebae]|uniref:AAA+ ATPase domain-containing protein n=1 Tax=Paramicrosporidium saccamoebae TaxID=1246581 RepID=A0A2H9TFM8_9FUNG|nr:hypothetical protein PSACC_03712 [Paramicrosporidium saccamoebae]